MISSVDALQAELQEKGLNRPQMVLLLGRQLMMDLAEEFSVDVPVQVERYKVGSFYARGRGLASISMTMNPGMI